MYIDNFFKETELIKEALSLKEKCDSFLLRLMLDCQNLDEGKETHYLNYNENVNNYFSGLKFYFETEENISRLIIYNTKASHDNRTLVYVDKNILLGFNKLAKNGLLLKVLVSSLNMNKDTTNRESFDLIQELLDEVSELIGFKLSIEFNEETHKFKKLNLNKKD